MNNSDQRHIARDSLFVMADMCLDGTEELHRIKMRNLSNGGMMGEGSVRVSRGGLVKVNIRNIGWVDGTVAWVQEDRFGVAFCEEIDPKYARAPVSSGDQTPSHIRNAIGNRHQAGALRKI
ncbi:MAG: PilZ domain-containing protein [Novosphingobium sp.]